MRFDKHKDPTLCVASEASRYARQDVGVIRDGEQTFLAATDGRALTLIAGTLEDGDEVDAKDAPTFPAEAFRLARKSAPRVASTARVSVNGKARVVREGGGTTEFPRIETRFPDAMGVVPKCEAEHVLCLDAQLLARIQKSLGASGVELRLRDLKGASMPIEVRPIYIGDLSTGKRRKRNVPTPIADGSFGLLMPISH